MAKRKTTFKGQPKPFGKSGHFNESRRHSLQARGIKTGNLAKPTINYAGKKLFFRQTYDEKDFPKWSDDAQARINHSKKKGKDSAVIHKGRYHHLYEELIKDTDGDGVPDTKDCDPLDPNKQGKEHEMLKYVDDKGVLFSQENNPENFYPSDNDTDYQAEKIYGMKWNDLGSEEQDSIMDDLINKMYQGIKGSYKQDMNKSKTHKKQEKVQYETHVGKRKIVGGATADRTWSWEPAIILKETDPKMIKEFGKGYVVIYASETKSRYFNSKKKADAWKKMYDKKYGWIKD